MYTIFHGLLCIPPNVICPRTTACTNAYFDSYVPSTMEFLMYLSTLFPFPLPILHLDIVFLVLCNQLPVILAISVHPCCCRNLKKKRKETHAHAHPYTHKHMQIHIHTNKIISCSDTVSRCGVFCSLVNATECCKTEGIVDVFQAVKALRIQKPGIVLTVVSMSNEIRPSSSTDPDLCLSLQEQYCFIFDLMLLFLDSFSIYSNFK